MLLIFCYIKIVLIVLRNLIFVVLMGGMVEVIYRLKNNFFKRRVLYKDKKKN